MFTLLYKSSISLRFYVCAPLSIKRSRCSMTTSYVSYCIPSWQLLQHQSAFSSIDVRLYFLAIRVRRPSDHASGFATSRCLADIVIFRLLYIGNRIGNISSTRIPRHEALSILPRAIACSGLQINSAWKHLEIQFLFLVSSKTQLCTNTYALPFLPIFSKPRT